MTSSTEKNPPTSDETGAGAGDDQSQGEAGHSVRSPKLDKTMPTGAALGSTWRMPAILPAQKTDTSHESGVRRLDLKPKLGDTLDLGNLLAGGGEAPVAPPSPSGRAHRRMNTLRPINSSLPPPAGPPISDAGPGPSSPQWEPSEAATDEDQDRQTDPNWPRHQRRTAEVVERDGEPSYGTRRTPQPGGAVGQPAAGPTGTRPSSQPRPRRMAQPALETTLRVPAVRTRGRAPWLYAGVVLISALATAAGFALWSMRPGATPAAVVLPQQAGDWTGTGTRQVATGVSSARSPGAASDEPHVVAPAVTTELVTVPSGAELVFRGAVIANTPARVVRPEYNEDYLVRKAGFRPQLVRIGPKSPPRIDLTMQPQAASEPEAADDTAQAP